MGNVLTVQAHGHRNVAGMAVAEDRDMAVGERAAGLRLAGPRFLKGVGLDGDDLGVEFAVTYPSDLDALVKDDGELVGQGVHLGREAEARAVGQGADRRKRGKGERAGGDELPKECGRDGGLVAAMAEGSFDITPAERGESKRQHDERQHQGGGRRVKQADAGEGEDGLVPEIGAVADHADADHRTCGQKACGAGAGAGEHQCKDGTDHGKQGIERREGSEPVVDEEGQEHHRKPERREGLVEPCLAGADAVAVAVDACGGTRQKFPRAGGREVEVGLGRPTPAPFAVAKADERQQDEHGHEVAGRQFPQRPEKEREDEVELFLDGEAPCVEERQLFVDDGEVAAGQPEIDVRDEEGRGGDAFGKADQGFGLHPCPGEGDRGRHHQEERGQDAAGAAFVEAQDRIVAGRDFLIKDGGDQEAADDEKDIDADEAAADGFKACMPEDDGQHRNRPQPVDFTPVLQLAPVRTPAGTPAHVGEDSTGVGFPQAEGGGWA